MSHDRLGIFLQRAGIFRWQGWRSVRVGLLTERDRRAETVLGIVERHVGRRYSCESLQCILLVIGRVKINRAPLDRLIPSPGRCSTALGGRVIRWRARRRVFRCRDKGFVFSRWLETGIPILKAEKSEFTSKSFQSFFLRRSCSPTSLFSQLLPTKMMMRSSHTWDSRTIPIRLASLAAPYPVTLQHATPRSASLRWNRRRWNCRLASRWCSPRLTC